MVYFDDKQKRLINSWHNLSVQSIDAYSEQSVLAYYMAFIPLKCKVMKATQPEKLCLNNAQYAKKPKNDR